LIILVKGVSVAFLAISVAFFSDTRDIVTQVCG